MYFTEREDMEEKRKATQANGVDEGRRAETITGGNEDYMLWEGSSYLCVACGTKGNIKRWVYNI